MKRLHIAIASMVLLGILVLVTVAHGIGGVTAAEDDRFRIKRTTLTKYLGTDTFVSVPDTVSSIGDEAFSGNETLTSIEIPSSVEQISYNAFKNCTALKSVILPASVEKVGPGAFEGCTALTSRLAHMCVHGVQVCLPTVTVLQKSLLMRTMSTLLIIMVQYIMEI